ncbi:MAG: 3-keto-5-aminohexanoate cleavage protein [Chloroflexota bacterium]|nr:MAG: 3-keto-5-aminohexanoate cleavage protein [Chloroflexota bacterium]
MDKLIITAAVTGTIVPSQSPYLPITPEQISDDAARASEAGAAIVHLHAREPATGRPTSDLGIYRETAALIRQKCDAIVCVTTGGGVGMTVQERASVVPALRPEMASFTTGSMNFGLFPAAARIKEWRFDWEKPYLEGTRDFVFKNTFADLEYISQTMRQHGTKPEVEIFDSNHLYTAAYLVRQGLLDLPVHMQFVMGVLGGIGSHPEDLVYLKKTADRLLGGDNYTWSVIGIGYPAEFNMCAQGILLGGNVRVGMEDNLFVEKGVLARSNGELVAKAKSMALALGREIATPEEARTILGLKGASSVAF